MSQTLSFEVEYSALDFVKHPNMPETAISSTAENSPQCKICLEEELISPDKVQVSSEKGNNDSKLIVPC